MPSPKELVRQLEDLEHDINTMHNTLGNSKQLYKSIEKALYHKMKDMPLGSFVEGHELAAVVHNQTVCSVENYHDLFRYILKTDNFQLINKQVNNKAWIEIKGPVPGTKPFIKKGIKLINKLEVNRG